MRPQVPTDGVSHTTPSPDELRRCFHRDGYALVRGVLADVDVAAALDHLAHLRAQLGLGPDVPLVAAPGDERARATLAADPRLTGLARALLGGPIACFGLTYLCKPARTGLPARWHQDAGPWAERLEGAPALTVWVALSDADESNGCLSAVPGSHHLPAQPLRPDGEPSLFGVGMDPALVDVGHARPLPVAAGDVVVHHPNLVHGSAANRSGRPRTAVAVRYRAAAR